MPGWLSWTWRRKEHRSDPVAEELAKLQIRHFDQDILEGMPIPVLRENFGKKTTDGFRIELLMRNIIWQLYEYVRADRPPEFVKRRGNIRGMWYHIKTRLHRCKELRGPYCKTMGKQLAVMVRAGLLSYTDFNFRDLNEQTRIIGRENPHIIVFAEKDSFFTFTEEVAATYGCITITLGGSPSLMSSNYLVSEMHRVGIDMSQTFYCFSIVDFDPRGEDAANDFVNNLKQSGLACHAFPQYDKQYDRLDIIQPKNLSENDYDVAGIRYELPASEQRTKLARSWAKRTGGVTGDGSRKYGLESDEFTGERLHELLGKILAPHLKTPAEVVRRRIQMRRLRKALNAMLVYKLNGTLPETHDR